MDFGIVGLLVFFVFVLLLWLYGSPKALPPGPRGLPLLGNFIQIRKDPHLKLFRWAEEFGNIFMIKLGSRRTIVINDAKLIKELLSLPSTTSRFKTDTILLISRGPYGMVGTNGEEWWEQRCFGVQTMAKHSFSKASSLESFYISGVQELIDWAISERQLISPTRLLMTLHANTILSIMTGERITITDSELADFLEDYVLKLQRTQQTGLGFLPWLKYIAPVASGFKAFDEISAQLHNRCRTLIDDRKKTHIQGAPRDFIDSYVGQIAKTTDPKSTFYGKLAEIHTAASLSELFVAGTETTSQTLSWLVLYLAHHPRVQTKLQCEIDDVIGTSRDPSLEDKKLMPYTEAVILETLRMSSIAPMGTIHEFAEDVKFQNYSFPKGALIIANLYYIHYDPKVWGDPKTFRPERFLDESGSGVINRELISPFQGGRRSCLGESSAKNMLFLFTAKFFQALEVRPDPGQPEANFQPEVGLILRVPSYKVAVKMRH